MRTSIRNRSVPSERYEFSWAVVHSENPLDLMSIGFGLVTGLLQFTLIDMHILT